MKIIAQPLDTETSGFSLPHVYLHGELERLNGFDLVKTEKDITIPFGIHKVRVNINGTEHDAKLFIWDSRSKNKIKEDTEREQFCIQKGIPYENPRWAYQHGLIVKCGDKLAMFDAWLKYKRREWMI